MKWLLFCLLFVIGCGPSANDRALSQVNVVAEKLSEMIDGDGWFKREEVKDADPWRNKLRVKYSRSGSWESLTVISDGPDGLPHTRDDIRSSRWWIDNAVARKIIWEGRKKAIGDVAGAITGGATKGIIKAVKE